MLAQACAGSALGKPDRWRKLDADLHKAIAYSASAWDVSASRLHACAHDEGGHGRFIDNKPYMDTRVPRIYGSDYDGDGWFQFLPSTWEWMSNAAWDQGRRQGRPPGSYHRIDSKLGQAWTAAWAFSRGLSYHWYGAAC